MVNLGSAIFFFHPALTMIHITVSMISCHNFTKLTGKRCDFFFVSPGYIKRYEMLPRRRKFLEPYNRRNEGNKSRGPRGMGSAWRLIQGKIKQGGIGNITITPP